MTRSASDRVADVQRLVDAARAIAADSALAGELSETTGLSRAGVDLALREHLETSPEEAHLARLVHRAGDAERVHVILASNVFVGALRAAAVARASSARVTLSPSRREPAFARALVLRSADPGLTVAEGLPLEEIHSGEVHVYGHDETVQAVRARVAPGVRVRAYGSGLGAALVTAAADIPRAAAGIARDLVPFDQRGCLSPRFVVVLGAHERAVALARELHLALAAWEAGVPRGKLDPEEAEASARYVATVSFTGECLVGAAHAVGLGGAGGPVLVPPPGRHVHLVAANDLQEANRLLAPFARLVVALGSDDLRLAARLALGAVRISPLGEMQRPPLDGPVDLRGEGASMGPPESPRDRAEPRGRARRLREGT